MYKIRSKPNKSFKGDNSKAIQYLHPNGQWQTIFNLYPHKFGGYSNDRFPQFFENVAQAKVYADKFINN